MSTTRFTADYSCPCCGNGWSTSQTDETHVKESCPFCETENVAPDNVYPDNILDIATEMPAYPKSETQALASTGEESIKKSRLSGTVSNTADSLLLRITGEAGNTLQITISEDWGNPVIEISNTKNPTKVTRITATDDAMDYYMSAPKKA